VLDVFAGTGALGLEALSRGATHVTFIEKDPTACRMIERNTLMLRATDSVTLLRRNALRPAAPPAEFLAANLLVMDPPYRSDLAAPALQALRARGWIARDAISVIEIATDASLDLPRGFVIADERRYGDTTLVFLKSEELNDEIA
jgi:16S rRNA (guanine966-N2)-methyltransferase